jgi:hypothetical protein
VKIVDFEGTWMGSIDHGYLRHTLVERIYTDDWVWVCFFIAIACLPGLIFLNFIQKSNNVT